MHFIVTISFAVPRTSLYDLIHSKFQGVILTPVRGLILLFQVELFILAIELT